MAELDLNCVASFMALVEHSEQGRAAAAAALHITSSALTKHIRRLENQLGVSLIARDGLGTVSISPAGYRFAELAGPLLAQAREARRVVSQQPKVTVRLGLAGAVGEFPRRHSLQTLSRDFRRLYSGGSLSCRGFPIQHLAAALLTKRVDVILSPRFDTVPRGLSSSYLWPLRRVAIVAQDHSIARLSQVDAEQACEHPILYDPTVPAPWMELFSLGDIRPLSCAKLVNVRALTASEVFRAARAGGAVAVSQEGHMPPLYPGLKAIDIINAPTLDFVATRRSIDNRDHIIALIEMLRLLR